MIRTGYKVCSGTNRFRSAFSFGRVVEYKINVWTYQPKDCGPLAVFRTQCGVDDFKTHNRSLDTNSQVFLCEYEESNEEKLYTEDHHRFNMLPQGTELATKVKLIKKIKNL